ncbi:tetratricopeptide repeat protein [Pseudomonas protegens]|uniref:Tetratricopeptide repeat protein n=1 Tax=Pseudomonas protegens TaxID=380021 RepID=A0A7G7X7Z0_9PSED|nr:tetratricopeptide repeat protein [Pseudomonas protegens]QNH76085.1 tetratricopeptide repeat protein [Pseudomonas protegens]QNL05279.1 tetratricopeptide repeat protein [Pseudomonas protegens]
MKTMMVAIGLAMLSGCASPGDASWSSLSAPQDCAKINSDQELSLSLADQMINSGKLHAGLANLQRLPDDLPAVRLRKAKIYRLLGQGEADPLYRSLLGGCLAAEGEQGLGQLAAERSDNLQALVHLQRAARLSPTDEKIRNDLGVVYLNQRRLKEARFEFITAMELKPSGQLPALNLVTLLIYQGNWKQASEVVSRVGLSPGQVTEAKARAEKLGTTAPNDRVASAGDPAQPEAIPSTTQR